MKNRIESRHNKYSTARSSSSSSSEDMERHEDKYKYTGNKEDRHKTHYNDKKERSYKRYNRDGNDSHSNSGGYNDSSDEESTSKRSNYRNTKDNNVMIKDEPASDDERRHRNVDTEDNRTNRRRFQNESKSRWRSRSRSPPVKHERLSDDDRRPMKQERFSDNDRRSVKKERFSEAEKEPRWGKQSDPSNQDKKKPLVDKSKPDFGLSGKLAEETNMYNGVVIKYSEPPEARKPKRRWRLYPFKGDEGLPTLYIHRQSAFLIGRDRKVADLPIDHPSCSKQHAVLQYRLVPFERNDGRSGKRICPYIIDLESANGTFVNNTKIEPKKYVELLEKDVIKFAFSSREYVLLHEHSKDSGDDDDM